MEDKFLISEDPKDIELGLAPEHYGDPATSCTGADDVEPEGLSGRVQILARSVRAALSSYPKSPGSVSRWGSARARGWGGGWPDCTSRLATVVGGGVRVTMRREIAPIVAHLLNYAERNLRYAVLPGQTGGFNCRPIHGTRTASNHSWGLAVDVNWQHNPMSRRFQCNMPPKLIAAFWSCGFYWGGWYRGGKYDTMHFEYIGRPADVPGHLARARALAGGGGSTGGGTTNAVSAPASGAGAPAATTRTVSLSKLARSYAAGGAASAPDPDTKELQARLNRLGYNCGTPDGFYGDRTKEAMSRYRAKKFDTRVGHPDTLGAPGRQSLESLGFKVIP